MFNKGDLHGAFLHMEEGAQVLNHDKADQYRMALMPTFCVRSIEETVAKAEKLGGSVHV
jgi:predicted enzyme related to lactoylglutathione lyase